jgi:tetratricopeptide (TPR) repeat protein
MAYTARLLLLVIALLPAWTPAIAGAQSDGFPIRTITVRVAADEPIRSQSGWEAGITRGMKNVSDVWEREFKIRFVLLDLVPWSTARTSYDTSQLLKSLRRDVPRGAAELLVGFSGRPCARTHHGAATILGPDVVVMAGCIAESGGVSRTEKVLSHEFAHLFGAFHVAERGSVMNDGGPAAFDGQTSRVIRLLRNHDFGRGVGGLDEPTRRAFLAIYAERPGIDLRNPLAFALSFRASALADEGKLRDAIAGQQEATQVDPRDPAVRHAFGLVLQKSGDLEGAAREFREAARLNPRMPEAYSALGVVLGMQKNLDESAVTLRKAIQIDPALAIAHANLGYTLAQQGRWTEAMTEYRESIRLDPNDVKPHINLASAHLQQRDLDSAVNELREALRIEPGAPMARASLGRILAQQGKLDEAATELREAIRLDPRSAQARGLLGIVLRSQRKADEAIQEFQEVLRIEPRSGAARYQLALTYATFQRYSEAWQEVAQARTLGFQVPQQFLDTLSQRMPEPGRP